MLETHGVWVAGTGHEGEGGGSRTTRRFLASAKGRRPISVEV